MVERRADKKIRLLTEILKAKGDRVGADSNSLGMTGDEFDAIVKELSGYNLFEISHWGDIPIFENGEPTDKPSGDTVAEFSKIDIKKTTELLEKLKAQFPKRDKPLIKAKALELISVKMGDFDNGINLHEFLIENGVDEELAIYPNTKWRMINDALQYLSLSERTGDQKALFDVIGESTHPLMHRGDRELADKIQNEFSDLISYDGFAIKNYRVIKADETEKPKPIETTSKIATGPKLPSETRKAKTLDDLDFLKDFSAKNLRLFRDLVNAIQDAIDLQVSFTEDTNLRVQPEILMGDTITREELHPLLNKLNKDANFSVIDELEWDDFGGFYTLRLSKINLDNLQTIRVFLNNLIPEKNKGKEPLQIEITQMPDLRVSRASNDADAKIKILKDRIEFGSKFYAPKQAQTKKIISVLSERNKGKSKTPFSYRYPLRTLANELEMPEEKVQSSLYAISDKLKEKQISLKISVKDGVILLNQT